MTPTRSEVGHIIAEHLTEACGVSASALSAETALFSRGMVDSIQIIGLVAFLETRFGIAIGPLDISLEHFDSLNALVDFVCARTGDQR